jgi:hypothetical protein
MPLVPTHDENKDRRTMLRPTRWIRLACATLVLSLSVTGCFRRGPELAPVTGTVLLDGEPLANAQVEFKPMRGSPSYGTTDSRGQYELRYTKDKSGAVVGTHVVRITTQTTAVDESGNEIQIPQRVPEKYNYRSKLIREVRPKVENRIDFRLESEPEAKAEEPGAKEGEDMEGAKAGVEKPKSKVPEKKEPGKQEPEAADRGEERAKAKEPGPQ